jgi:polar amino acid transport system substrate-binding protein
MTSHAIARRALFAGAASGLALGSRALARPLDDVLSAKKIRVGVNPTLPPLAKFSDKNELEGFDVDIAKRIAQMLGVELELVQVGSPDRIPFVASGRIDFVMGAMTRTPERAKVIDFTVPVHTEILGVLTTEARPYKSWKDLDDDKVTLVQVRGTTPVQWIERNAPKAKLLLLDNYPDAVRALSQGRGDAMVDVIDFVGNLMNNFRSTKWKVLETPVDIYYCSLGVAKNSQSLKDWLNVAIFELHRSGFIDQSWEKWFGVKMFAPTGVTPYF